MPLPLTVSKSKAPATTATTGYRIEKNVITLNGKRVGSLNRDGSYQLVDSDGVLRQGLVGTLLKERLAKGTGRPATPVGPSGKLRLHTDTLEVINGAAYLEGLAVGRVQPGGDFEVTVHGRQVQGNAYQLPGAVWLGGPGATGVVKLGNQTFVANNGALHEGDAVIGWLGLDRRFRGVTRRGDYFEGHLDRPDTWRYLVVQG